MGTRIWLPTHKYSGPYPFPQNEREELLQRLYKTGTLLPDARTMDISALRDYVQAQEDKIRQGHYNKIAPSKRKDLSLDELKQVRGALKEYFNWRRKKLQSLGLRPK